MVYKLSHNSSYKLVVSLLGLTANFLSHSVEQTTHSCNPLDRLANLTITYRVTCDKEVTGSLYLEGLANPPVPSVASA